MAHLTLGGVHDLHSYFFDGVTVPSILVLGFAVFFTVTVFELNAINALGYDGWLIETPMLFTQVVPRLSTSKMFVLIKLALELASR